jgi:hypothetical protein
MAMELSRVYELREQLLVFCQNEALDAEFSAMLSDPIWICKLAYLVDIFDVLNKLNASLQGPESNVLTSTDKLVAFRRKLLLWQNEINTNDSIEMFPEAVKADPGGIVLRDIVGDHLSTLDDELQHYFPSLDISKNDWIRNPFSQQLDLSDLTVREKEELIEISSDRTLQLKFTEISCNQFWVLVEKEHALIGARAVDVLLSFSTTYLCEKAFSAMTMIKSKYRERLLSLEDDLRVCLSSIPARLDKLSRSLQSHCSH